MSASEALTTCERALRQLMKHAYIRQYGASWIERVADPERIGQWRDRRDREVAESDRRGVAKSGISNDLLDYSDFYELRSIATDHWPPLAAALGKQKETMPLLNRFERLRNAVAHSRDLLPHEVDLLSGIAGEIRNKVTIYMSSQDEGGDYFPRVERVADGFGNAIENTQEQNFVSMRRTDQVVRVGDRVQYTCVGFDPQGRELEWELIHSGVSPVSGDVEIARGNEVTLTWNVLPQHVRHRAATIIVMKAVDAKYHRHSTYDEQVEFIYRVLPPS